VTLPPVLDSGEETFAAPRQTRGVEKRRKLTDAAVALFSEKGFDSTSIDDITSRAGTATGAFYIYFRSKRQLLIVLMNELLGRLGRVNLSPKAAAPVGLRRFLHDIFSVDLEYFGVIRAWHEAALMDPELGAMEERIQAWTQARILRVLQPLAKQPNARGDRDLPTFARMMDRHFWSLLARGASLSPQRMSREMMVAADVIRHYLFRDDAGSPPPTHRPPPPAAR